MSYLGLVNEYYELRELEHQQYHMEENFFEPGCVFCVAEKCHSCNGTGMSKDCNEICKMCDGRGRII
jgi:DnaJ-class molecular chaperone